MTHGMFEYYMHRKYHVPLLAAEPKEAGNQQLVSQSEA